jgi:hypothetical protein
MVTKEFVRLSASLRKPALEPDKKPRIIISYGADAYSLPLIRCRKFSGSGSIVLPNPHLRAAALFSFVYIAALSSLHTKSRELGDIFIFSNRLLNDDLESGSKDLMGFSLMQQC